MLIIQGGVPLKLYSDYYNNWISRIMLKSDRFSCSQKIRLKRDPPVSILGIIVFVILIARKLKLFRGHLFSNIVKIMLFISDAQY